MTNCENVQIGISYSPDQLQRLAAPAVQLADATLTRERIKRELNAERERADARASTLIALRDSYRDAKRRFRQVLAEYQEIRKGL